MQERHTHDLGPIHATRPWTQRWGALPGEHTCNIDSVRSGIQRAGDLPRRATTHPPINSKQPPPPEQQRPCAEGFHVASESSLLSDIGYLTPPEEILSTTSIASFRPRMINILRQAPRNRGTSKSSRASARTIQELAHVRVLLLAYVL